MYFRLNPECYLVRGKKRGAIFDLIDTKIYALDQQETELVTPCEMNYPVQKNEKFLQHLKHLRLGNFYMNKIYVHKLRVGSRIAKNDPLNPIEPPELHRAFLEINNSCNRDCWFCGYYGIKRSLGCMGCNKWKENGRILSEERWKTIVDELKDLDCKDIYLTGGDLTLAWDTTMNILDYSTGKFSNIYIILHQQSLSPEKIDDLKNKTNLIVQTEDLKTVKFENYATLLVVNPEKVDYVSNIKQKEVMTDFVIKDESFLSNNLPIMSKKKISPVNMYRFLNNIEYHPCLGRTLAICYNGNVIPCPMMRSHNFGNIENRELHTIFENEWEHIANIWKLNLDKIEKCTDCEFRYSCTDCRSLEENLTGNLEGKRLCCYDPEEGEWL